MFFLRMNNFDFENTDATTHQSYDWRGILSKLVYRLELLGALVFLCCLVYCIPIAAEFFLRMFAFVSSPPFVFVFFNVVIVALALSVKFGVFSAENVSNENAGGTDEEEEQRQQQLLPGKNEDVRGRSVPFKEVDDGDDIDNDVPGKSFFEDLNNNNDVAVGGNHPFLEEEVIVEDKEVIVCEAAPTQTTPTTECETSHEVEYEYCDQNPVDELSCEEFKKKIESFIENMRTFRRQEYWLESIMENNRTSIAVCD